MLTMDPKEMSASFKQGQDRDIFKDTYIRYLGYANEVGESFRALIHVNWVRLSYLVASGYVVADSLHKGYITSQKYHPSSTERVKHISVSMADTLLWQGLASIVIPGFTINRICALMGFVLKQTTSLPSPVRKWTTTGIGLACIPFIITPIDRSVDHLMNRAVRPFYPAPNTSDDKNVKTEFKS